MRDGSDYGRCGMVAEVNVNGSDVQHTRELLAHTSTITNTNVTKR